MATCATNDDKVGMIVILSFQYRNTDKKNFVYICVMLLLAFIWYKQFVKVVQRALWLFSHYWND